MPAKCGSKINQLEELQAYVDSASTLLKSLANSHRLMVLCVLAGQGREMCVSEINERIALSQSALSQHLARLRSEGLVVTRRDSQTILYSVAAGPALELIQVLQHHFCHS